MLRPHQPHHVHTRYDPAGNLVATTDARGAVTTRSYDASNRVSTSAS
ncbi:MAG: RHS repeat protein, partial [Acidobacteria bacterium]|nr:RHS repeat protein [Acidobacteriota bacterium]